MKNKTGDICPDCKNGNIALMSAYVTEAISDEEPYKSGEYQDREVYFVNLGTINMEACESCGKVYRKWFE